MEHYLLQSQDAGVFGPQLKSGGRSDPSAVWFRRLLSTSVRMFRRYSVRVGGQLLNVLVCRRSAKRATGSSGPPSTVASAIPMARG